MNYNKNRKDKKPITEKLPLKQEIKLTKYLAPETDLLFKRMFWGFIIFITIIMPLLSVDYGVNGDENCQVPYSERVWTFYRTLGSNSAEIETPLNRNCPSTYFYGGFFEFISAGINHLIGNDDYFEPIYHDVRHIINSLFGILTILFTGLLAKHLGNWRMAFLVTILLVLSPSFFGHSMNNPKDIPFAAFYIMSILYTLKVLKSLPKPSIKDIVLLITGISLSINIRIGGILLIAYFLLFFTYEYIDRLGFKKLLSKNGWEKLAPNTKWILMIVIIGFAGGLIFWPYGLLSPLTNPINAFANMNKHPLDIKILFDGAAISSLKVPANYILRWFSITNPVLILLSFAISVILFFKLIKIFDRKELLMILFTLLFPIGYAIYNKAVLYDGWRHFLFIYPLFLILAVLSIEYSFLYFNKVWQKITISCLILFLMFSPVKFMVANHPNQSVYFNELTGGLKGAYGKFETDYYMNSAKQAMEWLIEHEKLDTLQKPVLIATNCIFQAKIYFQPLGDKADTRYVFYYNRNSINWDYGIFITRFTHFKQLKNDTWPPKGVIYTVEADGVPLCVVVKNHNNSAYYATKAFESRDYQGAANYFKQAIEYDTNNDGAWYGLGMSYFYMNKFKDCIPYFQKSLDIHPDKTMIYNFTGTAFLNIGNFPESINQFQLAIKMGAANAETYMNMGHTYFNQKDLKNALQSYKIALNLAPNDMNLQNMVQTVQAQMENQSMRLK